MHEIPPVQPRRVVDPTGCGDAYRAGFLYGWLRGLPLETAGRLGSLLGSLKVERQGTQSLNFDLETVRTRFADEFGSGF